MENNTIRKLVKYELSEQLFEKHTNIICTIFEFAKRNVKEEGL